MDKIKANTSVLKMENLYFSGFEFSREESLGQYSDDDVELGVAERAEFDEDILTVKLMLRAVLADKFELKLEAVGKFKCSSDDFKADIFEKNAISIMFPYIRSEITLLTSQPNFSPIIMPPINVNALFDKLKSDND